MAEDTENARIVSLTDLSAKVDKLFDMLGHKEAREKASGNSVHSGDLDEQITKAVGEATAAEKAKTADEQHRQALEDRLSALEARRESKPKEYRKVTKFMWGSEE